jgi:hydrogenase maturation factor
VVPAAQILHDRLGERLHALHDPTEGGLATGVRELALAAGCGATIERDAVPILPETETIAAHFGLDPLGMLASGSLLAAAEPATVERLVETAAAARIRVTPIGVVTEAARGFTLRVGGREVELPEYASDEVTRAL